MIDIKVIASGSTGNAYLISDRHTELLLECGINYKKIQQATNFQTSKIAACLITHEHKDHCLAVNELLVKGINCYASQGTIGAIGINHFNLKKLDVLESIRIGSWTVLPFDVQHDAKEPIGYLLESDYGGKLLFATDTYYIKYRFTDLTHLLIECNYSEAILDENVANGKVHEFLRKRIMKSHFSLENLKEFLQANDLSKVEYIHLIHLSGTNADAELFKNEIEALTGKEVKIGKEQTNG